MANNSISNSDISKYRLTYFIFIWHGFFLGLTMSMLDLNTVFPALISKLTTSKILFGSLYSIMLAVPLIFNIIFSHFLKKHKRKKKFLLLGIYLRAFSFLTMAFFTYKFALVNSKLVISVFFLSVFIFSISAGFAGISYTEIVGKLLPKEKRTHFYASKQFFASIASFLGGLIVNRILNIKSIIFPVNYSINLFIGFIGLIIGSIAFILIKEPDSITNNVKNDNFISYVKKIPVFLKSNKEFKKFIIIENMTSFSVMLFPFYILFAKDIFNINKIYVGRYLIYQIIGTIFSNIIWGFLTKKFDSKAIVQICIGLGASLPIFAIMFSFLNPNIYGLLFFLIGFVLSGRIIGFDPYLLNITPSEHITEYLGIRGSLNIFIAILPVIGGIIIKFLGFYSVFIIVSMIMIFTAFFLQKES